MSNKDVTTAKSASKTLAEELSEKTYSIKIADKTYEIERLNLGDQAILANLVGGAVRTIQNQPADKKGKVTMSISTGDFLAGASAVMPEIIAIGLGEDLEVVKSWKSKVDQQNALEAFQRIMEVNDGVPDILGKSLTLLASI